MSSIPSEAKILLTPYRETMLVDAGYPGPNALSPTLESNFARMECRGNAKFTLHFMHQPGEWVGLYMALWVDW
jgi:hypothetical protein